VSKLEQEFYNLDAGAFQEPLVRLAEVLAQKVKREAPKALPAPGFVSFDLHILVRHAMYTYNLLFYLNADERRKNDCYWRAGYSIASLPLIRNMIDCLYNITAILQEPEVNGPWFRKSGFKNAFAAFDEQEQRYGGRPEWDEWIRKGRGELDCELRKINFTTVDVLKTSPWLTLGQYVSRQRPGGMTTPHQDFLRTFTYGNWREYSAMAHAGFDGLMHVGIFYAADSMPHEERDKLEDGHLRIFSAHIARAALMLLCIITELQAHFLFEGADINERVHKMWSVLMPVFEVKELYDQRYCQLMKEKHL
jgi:hypothetical protein